MITYNEQTQQWSNDGKPIYSINVNEMYDPETKHIWAAPQWQTSDPKTGEVTWMVEQQDVKEYTQYTFDRLPTKYDRLDDPLLRIEYQNPVETPTAKTFSQIIIWIHSFCVEGKLTYNVDFPNFVITILNPRSGNSENVNPGLIAHDIQKNGETAARTSLTAQLVAAKVL